MKQFEVIMPKLGESVQEATITKWFVKVGDKVEEDTVLLEIATDKVDSEIPSPVEGVISKILFKEGDVVPVGEVIAMIDLESEGSVSVVEEKVTTVIIPEKKDISGIPQKDKNSDDNIIKHESFRFYSPLVKSIAKTENISIEELESIKGTGREGRVTKEDILKYVDDRKKIKTPKEKVEKPATYTSPPIMKVSTTSGAGDEIIEMDRMRKLIADHMVMSKHTSPHVTTVVEADVTNLVLWRNRIKDEFQKKYGEKITFMPVFIEAISKALRDYPGINVSVEGYNIIKKKAINIGIAVALPTGNLIVPVIKNADQKNLAGLTTELNKLADNARNNKLLPDDIQGGTFTITNFGSFGNLMGTPIINQPQVAILATGMIQKKPAVLETPTGDVIAIRHKMYLSLSYDHRAVDGALGGAFVKKIADYLESYDLNRDI